MKAVIVDASSSVAVALRDDGQFVKIKNTNFSLGQEIRIAPQRVKRFPKQAAVAASAALVLTAGAGFGLYEWNSPYSYVSLDASPSIEYALNRFDVVIAVNGLNEEGQHVADTIVDSVKNTKIDKALEITVAALSDENYISNDDASNVVVSVYSDSDSKVVELISTVNGVTNTTPSNVAVAAVAVDKDTHNRIESGHKVDDVVLVEGVSIEKDVDSSDNVDVSPTKHDEAEIEVDDASTTGVVDEVDASVDAQKEKNTGDTSNADEKNKINESSSATVDKTEQKTESSNKNDNKSDKKNDNKNNKNDLSEKNESGKNGDSTNKNEAPAKPGESPVKGDVAPPKTEEELIDDAVLDEEMQLAFSDIMLELSEI